MPKIKLSDLKSFEDSDEMTESSSDLEKPKRKDPSLLVANLNSYYDDRVESSISDLKPYGEVDESTYLVSDVVSVYDLKKYVKYGKTFASIEKSQDVGSSSQPLTKKAGAASPMSKTGAAPMRYNFLVLMPKGLLVCHVQAPMGPPQEKLDEVCG